MCYISWFQLMNLFVYGPVFLMSYSAIFNLQHGLLMVSSIISSAGDRIVVFRRIKARWFTTLSLGAVAWLSSRWKGLLLGTDADFCKDFVPRAQET